MCTVFSFKKNGFFFCRNMDIECSFGEKLVIVNNEYKFDYKYIEDSEKFKKRYKMMGIASVIENTPMFAEGFNEKGLCLAALNFPGHNSYKEKIEKEKLNLCPHEIISYITSYAANVQEALDIFKNLNIVKEPFRDYLPIAPMHFFLSDENESYVIEPVDGKINIYENPLEILTNNPAFPFHLDNVCHYLNLSPKNLKKDSFAEGLSTVGLPGDLSPAGRFVRMNYYLKNALRVEEKFSAPDLFHLLDCVKMVRGSVVTKENNYDITTYSAIIDVKKQIYYIKTYDNPNISAYIMDTKDNFSKGLLIYDFLNNDSDIKIMN